MIDDKDKGLDDLFKKKLEDPVDNIRYEEEDWDALEQMLDKKKRRKGIVYLLPVLGSVAALMLIFFGWWALQPKVVHKNTPNKMQASANTPKANNTEITKPLTKQNDIIVTNPHTNYLTSASKQSADSNIQRSSLATSVIKSDSNHTIDTIYGKQFQKRLLVAGTKHDTTNNAVYTKPFNADKLQKTIHDELKQQSSNDIALQNIPSQQRLLGGQKPALPSTPVPVITNNNFAENTIHAPVLQQSAANLLPNQNHSAAATSPQKPGNAAALTSAEKMNILLQKSMLANDNPAKSSNKTQASFKPRFSAGAFGAQDINGAGSFKQSKVGTKGGLMVNAAVIGRFTISTGTAYSSTPYTASYNNYHFPYQFKTDPESITATCTMLDIPLNVGYQVYRGNRNIVTLGTGLSSYIMLQQNFNFNYANSATAGPSSYSYNNNEKDLFKIVNINATYEHQISSKAGITVQPYLKLPLAAVGYSQVKLQTSGLAVGLTWNLSSTPK